MPNIIICFKEVVDEKEIKVDTRAQKLILEGIPKKISDFDLNAIEEAVKIKEGHGGKVIGMIVGPPGCKMNIKKALSMGVDSAYLLTDPAFEGSDTLAISAILQASIEKLGEYDLIILGEATTDGFSAQVGPSLAERLGIPQITAVCKMSVVDEGVIAERILEDGIEIVEAPFPVLVTVTKEINKPRLPSLKQIMAASKKEIKEWGLKDLGLSDNVVGNKSSSIDILQITPFKMERKNIILKGEFPEIIDQAVRELIKEGVVSI